MIQTSRLKLIPLTLDQLEIGLSSIRELSASVKIPVVESLFDGIVHRAVKMKIEKMQTVNAELHPWFTYWLIVINEDNTGAGMVGFKGTPNARGEVEIGYGIDPFYQRSGFMSEAVRALVEWAFSHPECRGITAPAVNLDNFASQKVLLKNGFVEISQDELGISYRLDRA
jgi:ribosomal-protein-alanine N-acetyltransferase